MPVVADAQGYHPHLKVHLNDVTVSSSLNDIRLLATKSCKVRRWNTAASAVRVDVPSDLRRDAFPTEMGRWPPVDIHRLTQSTYLLPSS